MNSDRKAVSLVICPVHLALKAHESFPDRLYIPQANMTFRSGATAAVGNFPVIPDPIVNQGEQTGDVFVQTTPPTNYTEFNQLIANCRAAWQALDSTVTGITAVNIRRFVDANGNPTGLIGLGGIPTLSNSNSQADAGRVMIIDDAFTLPCSNQATSSCLQVFSDDPVDKWLGHKAGHALTLNHGNGVDDDGDGQLDEDGEEANPTVGSNLMQYQVGGTTITTAQSDRMRLQALIHIPNREVDPVLAPLLNSAADAVGDAEQAAGDLELTSVSVDFPEDFPVSDAAVTFAGATDSCHGDAPHYWY